MKQTNKQTNKQTRGGFLFVGSQQVCSEKTAEGQVSLWTTLAIFLTNNNFADEKAVELMKDGKYKHNGVDDLTICNKVSLPRTYFCQIFVAQLNTDCHLPNIIR